MTPLLLSTAAAARPAGGAALGQVAIATAFATLMTVGLLWLIKSHRDGRTKILDRLGAFAERVSGLPPWAGLPAGLGGATLLVALLGMYWDISLHIDQGRDPGPLANPAHYLILFGLYGIFAAGCLAIAMPRERPGPAAIRITSDWYAPVGGVLMATCGAFALIGFPLDDMWHRLFGQDVTLWGPTHLMLFGGAAMTLIGQAVLLQEGMRARRETIEPGDRRNLPIVTAVRRLGLMGGLLIGLSTFQGEFDFGVPQFSMTFHPLLIAMAAGVALVAARLWIGPGGAVAAALMYLVVRGGVSLIVGGVFGETTPAVPLYLGEAVCVELAALFLLSRPLAFGAAGGFLAGTVGFATEWPWTHAVFRIPWESSLMPEGLIIAAIAGTAGGLIGALLGLGLRGELPSQRIARVVAVGSLAVIAVLVANGLVTKQPKGFSASVTVAQVSPPPDRTARVTVRVQPPDAANDAYWLTTTSWQGGGRLVVDRLQKVGQGLYRSTKDLPVSGDWKSTIRLHRGREIAGLPIYMPKDAAIPGAKEIPATPQFTRPFITDKKLLQREVKQDVAGWLWTAASMVVLFLYVVFLTANAWGVARVARRDPRHPPQAPRAPQRQRVTPTPAGVPS
jgi:hypothetical protein